MQMLPERVPDRTTETWVFHLELEIAIHKAPPAKMNGLIKPQLPALETMEKWAKDIEMSNLGNAN